jgi:16S rRNA (guanine(966)-N(2))-methyltransferase RsmD
MGDRVKQTLFAILDPDLGDARVLDLYAGSGAAGIEALSRGASHVTFIERDADAGRVIRANLERTHLEGEDVRVVTETVRRWLGNTPRTTFDVVILDPPYDEPAELLAALRAIGPHLAPGGRVVAKHATGTWLPPSVGLLASERERRFGETTLTFFRPQEE